MHRIRGQLDSDKPAVGSIAKELSATAAGAGIVQKLSGPNARAPMNQAGEVQSGTVDKGAEANAFARG